jgi:1-acyl-sn-glycerol-3-phosphate acyltransferase
MAYFVNHIINSSLCFSGTTYRAEGRENLNNLEGNIIIVSNHQSMMDIPFIGVVFQKYAPRFIAKRELGRGIPFISLRLRNGGGILIDRGNASQAIKAIEKQAPEIAAQGGAICIFPEGTRAKDGIMKRFKPSGLRVLMKALNNPMIVPVSISNSWKLLMYKMMPLPFGTPVKMVIHPAIHTAGQSAESVIEKVEAIIRARVE